MHRLLWIYASRIRHQLIFYLEGLKWALSSENEPSNMRRFKSSWSCAKYHPGLCSPIIHSLVSNDSVSGQEGPDQTARMRRLIWAFVVRICLKTHFRMARPVYVCLWWGFTAQSTQWGHVMSSAVSLPIHTIIGQAKSSKWLTSIVHSLSPETDNCPSWISRRERMTVENISWSISTKECCRPQRGSNPRPPALHSDAHPTAPYEWRVRNRVQIYVYASWNHAVKCCVY